MPLWNLNSARLLSAIFAVKNLLVTKRAKVITAVATAENNPVPAIFSKSMPVKVARIIAG